MVPPGPGADLWRADESCGIVWLKEPDIRTGSWTYLSVILSWSNLEQLEVAKRIFSTVVPSGFCFWNKFPGFLPSGTSVHLGNHWARNEHSSSACLQWWIHQKYCPTICINHYTSLYYIALLCSCLGLGIIWDELPCTATGWLAHMMTIAGPPLTAWNCLGPGGLVIVLVSKTWAASWDILGFDQTHLLTTAGHIGWTPSGNILQPCHPSYRIWFSKSLHWLAVDHAVSLESKGHAASKGSV